MSSILPTNLPNSLSNPFAIGARVRWLPLPTATDWGTIVGLLFEWHSDLSGWYPRYCIRLDADSPSHCWLDSDWAWAWDLEHLESVDSSSAELQVEPSA